MYAFQIARRPASTGVSVTNRFRNVRSRGSSSATGPLRLTRHAWREAFLYDDSVCFVEGRQRVLQRRVRVTVVAPARAPTVADDEALRVVAHDGHGVATVGGF